MKAKINSDILKWNNKFPLDRWWRKKYKIPYLSKEHREFCFYNQYFEFHEDIFFNKLSDKEEGIDDNLSGKSSWWAGTPITEKQVDDWFNTPI